MRSGTICKDFCYNGNYNINKQIWYFLSKRNLNIKERRIKEIIFNTQLTVN